MAESKDVNTWPYDNKFVPTYIPDDLKWFEHDWLETWYRKNKCDEFLQDTDSHFKNRQIVNFDMITNGNKLDSEKIKQYHKIDHEEIKKYPQKDQTQIFSSIFRNIGCKDMYVNGQQLENILITRKGSWLC